MSLSRARKFISIVNMKTGYSRFPQAGVIRLDFRYRSNANDGNKLPRTYPVESPPIKKDTQGVFFYWRKLRDSLRDIISLHLLPLDSSYTSLIFIISLSLSRRGCKQPFHRLFGRLVLLENPRIVLRADSQPVRIPFHQRQNKTNRQKFACSFCLAEAKGFEPLRLLGKRFSRPPRYDHFDKLPFI